MSTGHAGVSTTDLRMVGLTAEEVLDFSPNINPLGASERVRHTAVAADVADVADVAAYPDRDSPLLREALVGRLQVDVGQLRIGNGSTELIHLLARARLRPGGRRQIFAPTGPPYAQ